MSRLDIFTAEQTQTPIESITDLAQIQHALDAQGVLFERWTPIAPVKPGDEPSEILAAFAPQIEQLQQRGGYQTVDVISLSADHPEKDALRKKFLSEHTHSEDEVRFFVAGSGLFCLHLDDKVYQVLCEKNDLISVPAKTKHWFDMGSQPNFVAIRLFTDPNGWIANYTGDDIAEHYPILD